MNTKFSFLMRLVQIGVLVGALMPMADSPMDSNSLGSDVSHGRLSEDLSHGNLTTELPQRRWATLIEREDRIVHSTGSSGPNEHESSRLGKGLEQRRSRSLRSLRDAVPRQRYQRESTLPFPEDHP